MRTNIDSNEIKRILEMHSKLKNPILSEQTATEVKPVTPTISQDEIDLKLIRDAEAAGCLKSGKPQYLKGTKKPVYVATTKLGKTVVFYPDMTYKFTDNTKSGKWKCDKIEINRKAVETKAAETTKLADSEKSKRDAFINNAKNAGYIETLTDEQVASGKYKKYIVPGSQEVFPPNGITMYWSPEGIVANTGSIKTGFDTNVEGQTQKSRKECAKIITGYYNAWKTKKDVPDITFNPMKQNVQSCINDFGENFSSLGGIFSKVDNYIKVLQGGQDGDIKGPLTYGSDSKWRL